MYIYIYVSYIYIHICKYIYPPTGTTTATIRVSVSVIPLDDLELIVGDIDGLEVGLEVGERSTIANATTSKKKKVKNKIFKLFQKSFFFLSYFLVRYIYLSFFTHLTLIHSYWIERPGSHQFR
jgi:hypothetical protein